MIKGEFATHGHKCCGLRMTLNDKNQISKKIFDVLKKIKKIQYTATLGTNKILCTDKSLIIISKLPVVMIELIAGSAFLNT